MANGKDTDILLERILNIKDGKLVIECLDITSIPSLPSNLRELHCSETKITSLPDLPSGLTYLDCSYTQITTLPDLPSNLRELLCSKTQITSLPDLPSSLTELQCSETQITSLPDLPTSLTNLDCSNTQITSLPDLPDGIRNLNCSYTNIISIRRLPSGKYGIGIDSLICNNTQLSSLPVLPCSLKELDCSNTKIKTLPNAYWVGGWKITILKYSNTLLQPESTQIKRTKRLDFSKAPLTELPPELEELWCDDSQFMLLTSYPNTLKEICICALKSDSHIEPITIKKNEKETYQEYHTRLLTLKKKLSEDPEKNLAAFSISNPKSRALECIHEIIKRGNEKRKQKEKEEIALKKQKQKDEEARKQKEKDDKREQAIQEQMSNITREMSLILERAEVKSIREEAERRMNTATSAERERLILHEIEKISIREEAERRHKLTKPSKLAAILASL